MLFDIMICLLGWVLCEECNQLNNLWKIHIEIKSKLLSFGLLNASTVVDILLVSLVFDTKGTNLSLLSVMLMNWSLWVWIPVLIKLDFSQLTQYKFIAL